MLFKQNKAMENNLKQEEYQRSDKFNDFTARLFSDLASADSKMTEIKINSNKLLQEMTNIFTDVAYDFLYLPKRKDILDNADRKNIATGTGIKIRSMKNHQYQSNATYSDYGTAFAGKERC